jgi:Tol biopolymer transport system component
MTSHRIVSLAVGGMLSWSVACDRAATGVAESGMPQFELAAATAIPSDIKIAFTRVTGSPATGFNQDVYGIREDGTGLVNLTDHPALDNQPVWSPDGSKLAFRSNRDGDPEIYAMAADGSGITRLTFHPGLDGEPAWSPDGSRIAFRRSEFFGDFTGPGHPAPTGQPAPSEIWVMNADGSDGVSLTRNPEVRDVHPSWSPDGSRIVFERTYVNSTRVDLLVMGATGTPQRVITPWGGDPQAIRAGVIRALDVDPAWSPDGEQIVFRALRDFFGYDLWTVTPDGKNLTELIERPGPQITPAWSPDGSRIIFANLGPGGGLQIINRDGTGLTALTSGTIDFWPTWRR